MAITFTRAEFFALAALYRADEIIGLDAAVLLPTDPESRAALYAEGRARLLARGLLRADDRGELEPDRTLDAVMRDIVAPRFVVWVSRHLPGQGRQWFLYYGNDNRFVEQTLPDATSHRLAVVGDANDMVARMLAILPIDESAFVRESVVVPAQSLAEAYRLAQGGAAERARAALELSVPADPTVASYMADLFASAQFSAAVTLIRIDPGRSIDTREIAIVQAPDEAWAVTQTRESDMLVAERMNANVLRATLHAALAGLTRATPLHA